MQGMLNGSAYGALELKRAYQSNLAAGLIVGVLLHVGAIMWMVYALEPEAPLEITKIVIACPDYTRTVLPNPWNEPVELGDRMLGTAQPTIRIPVPVPDDVVTFEYQLPDLSAGLPIDGEQRGTPGQSSPGEFSVGGGINPGIGYPDPDIFVAVEFQPVPIKRESPVYPDMARLSGREARLTVRALIEIDGSVLQALVVKSSAPDLGFEEAAIAAALKSRYKPAIQNGRPVAIWVSYIVEFRLK